MDLFRRLFQKNTEDSQGEPDTDERLVKTTELPDLPEAIPPESPQTRPLTPPETFRNPSRQIHYGIASDIGRERTNNQDGALTIVTNPEMTGNPPSISLFIVADGMGGHHDGEHASAVTVQTIAKLVFNEIILPQMEGAELNADQKTIPEVLSESFEAANQAVQIAVPDGGTTATCVVIRGNLAYVAHVGDSRAYLIADGNMELITRDHSLVRRLQELGQLTAEEAAVHPQRNVLYRAIGQGDSLEVDAATRRLPPSSLLLLCSDGLWGVLGDDRMAEILMDATDPQDACDQMIREANEQGGPDNITVLLVQMPD
jgi:serine/threonine protein phosphatase PrpC